MVNLMLKTYRKKIFSLYINRVAVSINPTDLGTGLKIKSVEAVSYGKALVSTPAGVEGMQTGGEEPAWLVGRDWTELAHHVVELLSNGELRKQLEERAKRYTRRYLSDEIVYAALKERLQKHIVNTKSMVK